MITKELLQDYFHADFVSIDSLINDVLVPIFGEADPGYTEVTASETLRDKAHAANIQRIKHAATLSADGFEINVFDVTLEDNCHIHRARKNIQTLIRQHVGHFEGALIAFHYANPADRSWRLSYLEKRANNTDSTSAKRYTYLCGRDYPCRTIAERFALLAAQEKNAKNVDAAFSVEALSDEFFNEYRKQYTIFCDYIVANRNDATKFGSEFATCEDKFIRDYVKKMMGRLTFLHFLQKKGWLGQPRSVEGWGEGNVNFMRDLFAKATEEQKDNFLDEILEPLFFDCLNDKREGDFFDTGVPGIRIVKIPYLNGGLFEKDEIDTPRSQFPKEMFQNLLDFYSQFNFTIDESDPLDTEVGVDPEMLGKIFENLLEDNKDKGAFYTPKEIVQYMCKESLIAYLVSESQKKNEASKKSQANFEEAIRAFVNDPEMTVTRMERYSEKQLTDLLESLQAVKICDPAIGSGAFPMGLLNLLVNCREALNKALGIGVPRAELKQHIILNNIYGVDIEKGAIDIARLRFWLSIVVDEDAPQPLPNFDYKFMQGNSLLEHFEGVDLSNMFETNTQNDGLLLITSEEEAQRGVLRESMNRYFTLGADGDKHQLRQKVNQAVLDLVKTKTPGKTDLHEKLAQLDISANDQFFLWHTWFADVFDKGGFDIVIGNPPYIQLQSDQGVLASLYEKEKFNTFARTGDIYCLFYEQGWRNLCNNGHLCFITSNKWMRAGYGEKTREFFATKTNPKLLIDFAGVKIFESATVDTNILLFEKAKNTNSTICCVTKKLDKNSVNNLSLFVQQNSSICGFQTSESWVILSPIEQSIKQKIEAVGTPLKDWDIQINYGIKTGFNDAFIISTEKRNELLAACQTPDERKRTEELIRPILRGRDIKRYGYGWAELWLINTHNGVRGKIDPININDYPAIKHHLDNYWDKISNRDDQGVTPYNLRNCAYLEDFDKPKIIYNDIAQRLSFALSTKGEFLNNTVYFITARNENVLNYLLKILNSKLIDWYYRTLSVQLGEKAVRMFSIYVLQIPIPQNTLNMITECLDDNELDKLVYDIYGLDEDERQVLKDFLYT